MSDQSVSELAGLALSAPTASAGALGSDIDRAARTDAHVLIAGEGNAGAGIVAHLIHERSVRSAAPMCTLRCAGLPDLLLESELFGHIRGSFPGAYRAKPGLLDLAANGTLFLDDVAEISARAQTLVLRFMDTGDVHPVGAAHWHHKVNVRLIATADGSLQSRIASGAFRRDLYDRLNTVSLALPPLRERREDISTFLDFLLRPRIGGPVTAAPYVSAAARLSLTAYDWPGNVNELKYVVDRLQLLERKPIVEPRDLPAAISGESVATSNPQIAK